MIWVPTKGFSGMLDMVWSESIFGHCILGEIRQNRVCMSYPLSFIHRHKFKVKQLINIIFFNLSPTPSHIYPLQVENCY